MLGRFDAVGFDLDHTLIRYKLEPFTSFLYELIRDHVVSHSHYPAQLKSIPLDQSAMHKALVWDACTGNTLKLSSSKRVMAASHGCLLDSASPLTPRMLSTEAIAVAYPAPLADFDGGRHPRWFPLYTYFEMPSLPLVQMMVECTDRGMLTDARSLVGRDVAAGQPYGHIFPALSAAFEFHLASGNQGSYFSAFRADPSRFVERRPEIAEWLRSLRAQGHFVFLATNSKFDYCDLLCTYSFGADWQRLFDVTIVDAKKPSWFMEEGAVARAEIQHASTMKNPFARAAAVSASASAAAAPCNNNLKSNHVPRPFYFVDPQTQLADFNRIATEAEMSVTHALFVHGNAAGITRLVKQFVKRKQQQAGQSAIAAAVDSEADPSIIYFGDHLHSDCMATRQFTNWAAGAIVEEIEPMHDAATTTENGTTTAAAAAAKKCETAAAAASRRRHETFHSLDEIVTANAACSSAAASSFGSFFHHHHPAPSTAATLAAESIAADGSCCSSASPDCAVASAVAAASAAPEWTYWHHVLDLHCEVVVGCLSDFVRGDDETKKETSSSPNQNAAVAASSCCPSLVSSASAASPSALPTLNVRLNASCVHAPTFVRFHPPAFGSHYSSETPASIEAYRAAAQAAEAARRAAAENGSTSANGSGSNGGAVQVPAPQEALLQYSIHRVPVSMKMELRPIFPELSTLPAATAAASASSSASSPSSSSGVLSASDFKSLPILAVPTFQPSSGGLAMVSLTAEVEREKNRMLEVFHAFASGVCGKLRAEKQSDAAESPVWAEIVDPCSGYPVIGPHGSSIYSEVEGSAVLLGYRMEQVGSCACIDHPLWHLAHYPATLLTTASVEQTLRAIEQTVAELQPNKN